MSESEPSRERFDSVEAVHDALGAVGYVSSAQISTSVFLASALDKPILCEGPAGVGKTELAKATARALGTELVRLQCYEGLDESKTLYEWQYAKQLLYTQMLRNQIDDLLDGSTDLRDASRRLASQDDAFFSEQFLEPRPLLKAMKSERQVVLLIDEVDRAEEELEAFFLEVLAEYQVTVPELGTIVAKHKPIVFLTSNNTRELSDALRRRCLHLAIDYPSPELEARIIESQLPDIAAALRAQVVGMVARVRELQLKKAPGISETLDWVRALTLLGAERLDSQLARDTLNVLLKYTGDQALALSTLDQLLAADES